MADEPPAANHRVCPRCGTPAGESGWCAGCGLNLRQQGELPTAEAYAAKVREQQWLDRQEEEREAAEQAAGREAAEREQQRRAEAARLPEERRQRTSEAKPSASQENAARPRKLWRGVVLVALAALALIGAGSALLLSGVGEEEPTGSASPAAGGQAQEAEPSSPPEDGATDGVASDDSSAAGTGTLEECADFKTAGPFVEDIEALGIDCSEATQFITAWEEDGPGTSGTCAGPDGATAYPCEYQGWTCDSIQSGYESSAFDCSKGDATVRWESGF